MSMQAHTALGESLTLLFSSETIAARVQELGAQISHDYAGQEIVLVGVLKGAFVFLADLMRLIEIPARIEFVRLASYGTGTISAGQVRVVQDLDAPSEGQHVVIVEDILDTGLTLSVLLQQLRACQPASLSVCVLLNKRVRTRHKIVPDYVGFEILDGFVVGYGTD